MRLKLQPRGVDVSRIKWRAKTLDLSIGTAQHEMKINYGADNVRNLEIETGPPAEHAPPGLG